MVYASVIELLEQSGTAYHIHHHPAVTTIDEAHRKVPHLTRNLLKTVVFKIKHGDWVLAAVGGHNRIDYKRLADAVGVNRRALRSIAPHQVESELGFAVGGVGPFAVRRDVRVIFDAAIQPSTQVFCGSGRNTRTVEINAADLIALGGGNVHPIGKAPSHA
jgi:Cys-tRNA(Pro)/Cys-tRNA(Cys) deacylase